MSLATFLYLTMFKLCIIRKFPLCYLITIVFVSNSFPILNSSVILLYPLLCYNWSFLKEENSFKKMIFSYKSTIFLNRYFSNSNCRSVFYHTRPRICIVFSGNCLALFYWLKTLHLSYQINTTPFIFYLFNACKNNVGMYWYGALHSESIFDSMWKLAATKDFRQY